MVFFSLNCQMIYYLLHTWIDTDEYEPPMTPRMGPVLLNFKWGVPPPAHSYLKWDAAKIAFICHQKKYVDMKSERLIVFFVSYWFTSNVLSDERINSRLWFNAKVSRLQVSRMFTPNLISLEYGKLFQSPLRHQPTSSKSWEKRQGDPNTHFIIHASNVILSTE